MDLWKELNTPSPGRYDAVDYLATCRLMRDVTSLLNTSFKYVMLHIQPQDSKEATCDNSVKHLHTRKHSKTHDFEALLCDIIAKHAEN